jgi:peptide/nickel transport system substrate-binding protein
MVLAPVIMIVVIIVVGAGGYAALSAVSGSGSTTVTSCAPASSPACKAAAGGNDVSTFVAFAPAFGASVLQVTQGQSIPITVAVPESTNSYQVNWGDGSNNTQGTATFTHSYSGLGSYVISGEASVKGVWHTGTGYLYPVNVGPSLGTESSGEYPTIAATLNNGTGSSGWIQGGQGTVSVTATYTTPPANPAFVPQTTSFTSSGGTKTASTPTASGGTASYSFSSAGVYTVTMVGPISTGGTSGLPATIYQNYTWTVFVGASGLKVGCGQCRTASSHVATSPHAGTITDYEVAPAGATTTDPAIAYDTVSAEIVYNVYQTLVTYNGSSTATFIPQLATCVPGSQECVAQYGSNLTSWSGGGPVYWTFVLDKNARFYDPATKASWPVYPTDVEYSIARTLSFADLPGIEATAGWILAQSLLPAGNLHWDASPLTGYGIHQPFNNTPYNILHSMLVNDSTYCPSAAMSGENGCITFVANGPGAQNGLTLPPRDWSNFLQFISDPLGGAVVPSGWYMNQGAGAMLPGWPASSHAGGDGPTTLPGGFTSSSTSGYWAAVNTLFTNTSWDSTQKLAFDIPNVNKEIRYNTVGSGPYYQVGAWNPSVGYVLAANPAYQQPMGCAGLTWCEPKAGAYAPNVKVFWGASDTNGIQQYIAGDTDFATILQPETPTLLSLVQQGKIGAFTAPTLNIFFFNYAETFNVGAAQAIDPFTLNVPGNFFASDSVRNFVNDAYPYTTIENTINTIDGIQFGYNYGGAIPGGMGNYYPENITWANSDPTNSPSTPGTAAWWWAQMISSSSPYYDAYVADTCTTSSPCEFPIIGELGAPSLDAAIQLWIHEIVSLSGGRLSPNTFDLSFTQLVVGTLSSPPSTLPFPLYTLAWAPDYPDPTDYVPTLWTNGSYGLPDAAFYTFSQAAYNSPSCGHLDVLPYWANMAAIPADCQGVAFMTMDYWMGIAGTAPAGANRVLLYNMIEHIGNALALQQYTFQQNGVGTYAPWINPATIDINPMWAGDGLFYFFQGNGVVS